MDRELLSALGNLSFALEAIADALEKAKNSKKAQSNVGSALSSTDINEKLELLDQGVKQLIKDNKIIIENQKTLIEMAKKKDKGQVFSEAGDKKNKSAIEGGVKTVLIIAAGVLAIGLAFKLIGSVDFVSVIALALALPLVAIAFKKISEIELKNPLTLLNISFAISASIALMSQVLRFVYPVSVAQLFTSILIAGVLVALSYGLGKILKGLEKITFASIRNLWLAPIVFVAMSISIALSSYVLQAVMPVGFYQMVTAILIAGMFAAVSYSLSGILKGIGEIDPLSIILLPLLPFVMLALSVAITVSSYILALVRPVGLFQLLTAIMIGAMFSVLSFGMAKIIAAFKEVNTVDAENLAITMPILLIAMTGAIVASSWLLSMTKVVSFQQWLVALGISILFIPLAYSLVLVSKAIEKLDKNRVLAMPAIILTMVGLVWLSSLILSQTASISTAKLWEIFWLGFTVAAISAIFGLLFTYVLNKIDIKTALIGAAVTLIVTAVVAIASNILAQGVYEVGKYPDIWWVVSVGLCVVIFGIAVTVLGAIAATGIGAVALALGAVAVVGVARIIVAVSHILAKGNYKEGGYPDVNWSIGVISAMVPIATMAIALGALFLTGIGAAAYALGKTAIPDLADTIVLISKKLLDGKYQVPGLTEWSFTMSHLFKTFSKILIDLGMLAIGSGIIKYFTGKSPYEKACVMLGEIADAIVSVSKKLSGGTFRGGPTKEWAEGMSLALGAFSKVFEILEKSKGGWFSKGGPTPQEYKEAIETISSGIVTASTAFSGFAEKPYPKKEWAEGVGGAIGAFAPVFAIVAASKDGWFTKGIKVEEYVSAIETISKGIVAAADFFSANTASFDPEKAPKKEWSEKVSGALAAFMPAIDFIGKNTGIFTSGKDMLVAGIETTSTAIVNAARILGGGDYTKVVPETWSKNVDSTVKWYVGLAVDYINPNKDQIFSAIEQLRWTTYYIELDAKRFANITKISSNFKTDWMETISKNVRMYIELAKFISSDAGKVGDNSFWGSPVTGVINDMAKLASAYDTLSKGVSKLNIELEKIDVEKLTALKNLTGSIILMSLMDSEQFNSMMTALEEKASIFVETINDLEDAAKQTPGKQVTTAGVKVKEGGAESKKATLDDIYGVLQSVDGKLSQLNTSAGKLTDYVDEIRDADIKMKKEKGR